MISFTLKYYLDSVGILRDGFLNERRKIEEENFLSKYSKTELSLMEEYLIYEITAYECLLGVMVFYCRGTKYLENIIFTDVNIDTFEEILGRIFFNKRNYKLTENDKKKVDSLIGTINNLIYSFRHTLSKLEQ